MVCCVLSCGFFLVTQKTAYELRISDWSADVCSSDRGKLAYLMSTRSDADCNVGYYGGGLGDLLGEAGNIERPLLLHIAEKDRCSSPEEIDKVKQGLAANGKVNIHIYAGQDHAFARSGGEHYDAASAKRANERTINFFKEHLA